MKKFASAIVLTVLGTVATAQDCVVLLHGLARSENSFAPMQLVLEHNGYLVVNSGYPSTEATVQQLIAENLPADVTACGDKRVNFVTIRWVEFWPALGWPTIAQRIWAV